MRSSGDPSNPLKLGRYAGSDRSEPSLTESEATFCPSPSGGSSRSHWDSAPALRKATATGAAQPSNARKAFLSRCHQFGEGGSKNKGKVVRAVSSRCLSSSALSCCVLSVCLSSFLFQRIYIDLLNIENLLISRQ